jgi:hypothetical protein
MRRCPFPGYRVPEIRIPIVDLYVNRNSINAEKQYENSDRKEPLRPGQIMEFITIPYPRLDTQSTKFREMPRNLNWLGAVSD